VSISLEMSTLIATLESMPSIAVPFLPMCQCWFKDQYHSPNHAYTCLKRDCV